MAGTIGGKPVDEITIEILLENDAMQDEVDVATALRDLADRIEGGNMPQKVIDYNGLGVGTVCFLRETEDGMMQWKN